MRAKRVDGNQREIVKQLRLINISVFVTSALGEGFPDICCGFMNKNYFFEIKDPTRYPSQRVLTAAEHQFFETWRGQVDIIQSAEEAMEIMLAGDKL